ncbi:MAG: hypothetical protein H0Z33_06070 [Bacillaceae bacterium]|nr:hypothetical protein [Bacillaceae bacterium]
MNIKHILIVSLLLNAVLLYWGYHRGASTEREILVRYVQNHNHIRIRLEGVLDQNKRDRNWVKQLSIVQKVLYANRQIGNLADLSYPFYQFNEYLQETISDKLNKATRGDFQDQDVRDIKQLIRVLKEFEQTLDFSLNEDSTMKIREKLYRVQQEVVTPFLQKKRF